MNRLSRIKSKSLQAAFLRDEIPEAMVWLRKEGFDTVEPKLLERYLWTDTEIDAERLDALVERGLLRRTSDGRYELTEAGSEHGARVFAHHFAEMDELPSGPVLCACGCCGEVPEPDGTPALRGVPAGSAA